MCHMAVLISKDNKIIYKISSNQVSSHEFLEVENESDFVDLHLQFD